MGTWGGAERVVQPTDLSVWSVFVFLKGDAKTARRTSVAPESGLKGF